MMGSTQEKKVAENIDGWLEILPGDIEPSGPQPGSGSGKFISVLLPLKAGKLTACRWQPREWRLKPR